MPTAENGDRGDMNSHFFHSRGNNLGLASSHLPGYHTFSAHQKCDSGVYPEKGVVARMQNKCVVFGNSQIHEPSVSNNKSVAVAIYT